MRCWGTFKAVLKREWSAYFGTPLAYVVLVVFLSLASALTFYQGGFFGRGQADLNSFFIFLPWLFLFLAPALSMRLWAEERKTGTIEMLLTLPISLSQWVMAKFLASWLFMGVAIVLTFPLWVTVNILGQPDNGAIAVGYTSSWLMAGAYLSIGCFVSALNKNQVIAFIITIALCFIFTVSGSPMIVSFFKGWAPDFLTNMVLSLSFLTHFSTMMQGVISLSDGVFFISVMALFLCLNMLVIDLKRG